jgi:hypothetical protein
MVAACEKNQCARGKEDGEERARVVPSIVAPAKHVVPQIRGFPDWGVAGGSEVIEYMLVDRGTWYAVSEDIKGGLSVYKEAFDAAEDDPLLNPAHVLMGHRARGKTLADDFVQWLVS